MSRVTYEQLLDAAAIQAGSKDFGDEGLFGPALRQLLSAVEAEAGVEQVRVWRSAAQWIGLLCHRAKMTAFLRRHPEVEAVPLPRPIFVVGLPRTGTTLLHNLLARHPEHRAPLLWEMRTPFASNPDVAIRETQSVLDLLYTTVPEFRRIHPMNATWPDECSWLFRHNFATMVNAFTYRIPSYASWMCEADMVPYYQEYRLQLQLLQWQKPSRRLVLKDPCHLWHLPSLFSVFPDAEVLWIHRALTEALPSMASLCHALSSVESTHTDPQGTGVYCMDMAERGLLPALRYQRAIESRQITNVSYRDLVADPKGAIVGLCARVGSSASEVDVSAMLGFMRDNPQHKAGRHVYTLEQYGMDSNVVARRFGPYLEANGL